MDVKHREVVEWLESVYVGESVPEYEKTETSINLLHALLTKVHNAERWHQTLQQDYILKSKEYIAKAEHLSSVLQNIGINKSRLSTDGLDALTCITAASCAVHARNPSESDIILGYTRLEAEHNKVTRKSSVNQHLRSQLVACSQRLAAKIQHANSIEQQAVATTALEEEKMHDHRKKALFHEKKLSEYKAEICTREACLQHAGYSAGISHERVMDDWQELQQLKQEVSSVEGQLSSYSLPPDMAAVRLAVHEAKQKLDKMMTDMAETHA